MKQKRHQKHQNKKQKGKDILIVDTKEELSLAGPQKSFCELISSVFSSERVKNFVGRANLLQIPGGRSQCPEGPRQNTAD